MVHTSTLPDNSQPNCRWVGRVAVVRTSPWSMDSVRSPILYPCLFGWHVQQLSTSLGLGKGEKKDERWRDMDPALKKLCRGVKHCKLGMRQKWRAWRGLPRDGTPKRLSWTQGVDYLPRGSLCQGQRQNRSRVLGELQAFAMWLEGRDAKSEAGKDREDLGSLSPARVWALPYRH